MKNHVKLPNKKALLLDMNSTFMFGEDRFGENEKFYAFYEKIGGDLSEKKLNKVIKIAYAYLDIRYPDEKYRHSFPSLKYALEAAYDEKLTEEEMEKIIDTFAYHELGHIPREFNKALHKLKEHYILAVVIDIWSPKKSWLEVFEKTGINKLFSALSFSSDHGMVKPSPKPFENVVTQLGLRKEECLVIGDSVRRDLGGAIAAKIDCILVGGTNDPRAVACYPSLLDFCNDMQVNSYK